MTNNRITRTLGPPSRAILHLSDTIRDSYSFRQRGPPEVSARNWTYSTTSISLSLSSMRRRFFGGRPLGSWFAGVLRMPSVSVTFNTHNERTDFFTSFELLLAFLPASSLGTRDSILVTVSSLNWYQPWFLQSESVAFSGVYRSGHTVHQTLALHSVHDMRSRPGEAEYPGAHTSCCSPSSASCVACVSPPHLQTYPYRDR